MPRNVAATRASGSVGLTPTYARPLFLYVFESCFQLRSLFRLFIQFLFFLLLLFIFLLFLTLVLIPLAAFVTHCVHPFLLLIIFSPQRATTSRGTVRCTLTEGLRSLQPNSMLAILTKWIDTCAESALAESLVEETSRRKPLVPMVVHSERGDAGRVVIVFADTISSPGLSGQKKPTVRVSRSGCQVSMVFAITSDLRYIKNPPLDPDTDSIWVFGLRVRGAL